MDQSNFLELMKEAVTLGASDIHLRFSHPPALRTHSELKPTEREPLNDEDLERVAQYLLKDRPELERLNELKECDGSFSLPGLARFRFNLFRFQDHLGVVLRIISEKIATLEELGLPPVLKNIAESSRGLVLVTGATGSGKSSTLAGMIDWINSSRQCHILTIEDPIEFVHPTKKALITQREVGKDTELFKDALRAGLRQDPDVILVGEMRDTDTIDIALKAAETGHLVFSTVHTTDAEKTIGRLISMFPADEQKIVRMRFADNLKATISQRLVKRKDGQGRVAAQEIMVCSTAISDCIADPTRTHEINDFIVKESDTEGSQTFEQALMALYRDEVIDLDTAKEAATNAADFERDLMYDGARVESAADETNRKAKTGESQSKVNKQKVVELELVAPPKKKEEPQKPDSNSLRARLSKLNKAA